MDKGKSSIISSYPYPHNTEPTPRMFHPGFLYCGEASPYFITIALSENFLLKKRREYHGRNNQKRSI